MPEESYLGARLSIVRSSRKTICIQVKPGEVIVRAPLSTPERDIRRFMEQKRAWTETHLKRLNEIKRVRSMEAPFTQEEMKAMKSKALELITEKVKIYAAMMGVDYGRISIRSQRKRWGSCTGRGDLSFNCLLALMPEEVMDSIVVHELCHRRYMNHSQDFYAMFAKYFPEYKKCRAWLKENGGAYLARLPEK